MSVADISHSAVRQQLSRLHVRKSDGIVWLVTSLFFHYVTGTSSSARLAGRREGVDTGEARRGETRRGDTRTAHKGKQGRGSVGDLEEKQRDGLSRREE
ncbi:hypothetical protein E2C01_053552 [Portunus trituberculatus]|uniref:Uncharacterized protein n=1 Tax=Portunus trituberculatus TaxID=210409 RepID=A0A5B7GPI2_PORTR|nr:hypothetical protein [Portunus trituberculatus]